MKNNSLNQAAKMETYLVQAILYDKFEDLYVKAASEQEAIEKAKKNDNSQINVCEFCNLRRT